MYVGVIWSGSSSLLEELVCPSCPMTCKVASSANIPIRNQLNSNDLEYHKKYPTIMDHSYVGVCATVENHAPPTPNPPGSVPTPSMGSPPR